MRILLDTDVLLDVALAREPHVDHSAAVLQWAQAGGEAAVVWHSLTNCSYLLKGGRPFLNNLLKLVDVATVGSDDARLALGLPMSDVEDAFQAAAVAWKPIGPSPATYPLTASPPCRPSRRRTY